MDPAQSVGRHVTVVRVCWFQGDGADQDVIVRSCSEHCGDANMELWLTAICGYKGPLLVSVGTARLLLNVESLNYSGHLVPPLNSSN